MKTPLPDSIYYNCSDSLRQGIVNIYGYISCLYNKITITNNSKKIAWEFNPIVCCGGLDSRI